MLIDRRELIVFFDERGEARSQHAKAIKEVAGEELGLHLLIDFFRRQDKEANVLEERCISLGEADKESGQKLSASFFNKPTTKEKLRCPQ